MLIFIPAAATKQKAKNQTKMKTAAKPHYKKASELSKQAKQAKKDGKFHTAMLLKKAAQEHFDKATIIDYTL